VSDARHLVIAAVVLNVAGCELPDVPESTEPREQTMVFIEGATFRMGTDESELDDIAERIGLSTTRPFLSEVPSHEVSVNDYYMDALDVTNRDFLSFVGAVPEWKKENLPADQQNGRYLEHWSTGEPVIGILDHPVVFITWHTAVAYCDWRDKRLPTEAEFEWAAQSGAAKTEFPWGNEMPDDSRVNWGGNAINTTVRAGSYPPNLRGLFDMAGNVWHFTASPWLGSYAETLADPVAAVEAANDPDIRRVVRGGSFGANAANLRIRYRDSHRPYDAREMVGFRCARSAD